MSTNAFWADLQAEVSGDPEYAHLHLLDWVRITTVDRIVNELDERRATFGVSKSALARAVRRDPAAIRRMLSDPSGNPTLESVSAVAAVLGLRLELVPMTDRECASVSQPLRDFGT